MNIETKLMDIFCESNFYGTPIGNTRQFLICEYKVLKEIAKSHTHNKGCICGIKYMVHIRSSGNACMYWFMVDVYDDDTYEVGYNGKL